MYSWEVDGLGRGPALRRRAVVLDKEPSPLPSPCVQGEGGRFVTAALLRRAASLAVLFLLTAAGSSRGGARGPVPSCGSPHACRGAACPWPRPIQAWPGRP